VAKQLAHNSINGTDDPSVLLQLLDEINDVNALLESALNRDELAKQVQDVGAVPDVQVDFDWKTVVFAFLPTQLDKFEELCNTIPNDATVYTADMKAHGEFVKTMRRLGVTKEIRNVGTIIAKMAEMAADAIEAEKKAAEATT
jgi:hypothetical protein